MPAELDAAGSKRAGADDNCCGAVALAGMDEGRCRAAVEGRAAGMLDGLMVAGCLAAPAVVGLAGERDIKILVTESCHVAFSFPEGLLSERTTQK